MLRRRFLTVGLTAVTLLLISLILFDWSPLLRGPAPETAVWHWGFQPRPFTAVWPALGAAALLLGVFAWWNSRDEPRRRWTAAALIGLILGSFLLQLALVRADRAPALVELVDRTLAVQTNGYFWTAAQVDDLSALLRDYPQAMTAFTSDHARTHPPGLVVLNRLTIGLLERTPTAAGWIAEQIRPCRCTDIWLYEQPDAVAAALGVWALLPLLLAATAVLPAYLLARRLSTPPTARLAAGLTTALPALLLFTPLADQLYPLLTLFSMLALHHGLEKQRAAPFFLSGLLLSISSFLTLGNAALLLILLIYSGLYIWKTPELQSSLPRLAGWGVVFGCGAALIWLLYWLGWGVPPWRIAQAGMAEHFALVASQREYGRWLLYNLVDLLLFGGMPLVVGLVGWLVLAPRGLATRKMWPVTALATAVFLFFLLLNLSGATRGEVGRIWLFAMPLLLIAAAGFWAQRSRQTMLLVLALQLALTVSIGLRWTLVEATIVVAERPATPPPPAAYTPSQVAFGETILLDGYTLAVNGNELALNLIWQAHGPAARPYTVFTHLVDAGGQVVAQQDNWPVNGAWPPSCWQSGEQIVDPYQIDLTGVPPGQYDLLIGFYDAATGLRLPTSSGTDALLLQTITR